MKKFIVVLCLFWVPYSYAAHRISQVIVKGNGIAANISPGAKVLVCIAGTGCTSLAPVFLDASLTTPIPNPITADGSGNYDYYTSAGTVDEQISAPGAGVIFLANVQVSASSCSDCVVTDPSSSQVITQPTSTQFGVTTADALGQLIVSSGTASGGSQEIGLQAGDALILLNHVNSFSGGGPTSEVGISSNNDILLNVGGSAGIGASLNMINGAGNVSEISGQIFHGSLQIGGSGASPGDSFGLALGGLLGLDSFTGTNINGMVVGSTAGGSNTAEILFNRNTDPTGTVDFVSTSGKYIFNSIPHSGSPFKDTLDFSGLTAARTLTFPDVTGTLCTTATCSGGSGTVTSFSAGNLSPLFTTSVATATSTPALSFSASTAAQNSFLAGPSSGGTGAYSFRSIVPSDVPTLNQSTTGTSGGLAGSPAITVSNLTDSTLTSGQCVQASTGGLLTTTGSACGSGGGGSFSGLTSGTNTTAAMLVGSGASLAPTGTGTITPSNITGLVTAGTNVTIGGSGTTASPYSINSTSTASTAFSALTSSTNTTAAMVVGSGASLGVTGSGTISATAAPWSGLTGTAPSTTVNGVGCQISSTCTVPVGTIPNTPDLLIGGASNTASSSGIAPSNVPLLNAANVFSSGSGSNIFSATGGAPFAVTSANTTGTFFGINNTSTGSISWTLFDSGSANPPAGEFSFDDSTNGHIPFSLLSVGSGAGQVKSGSTTVSGWTSVVDTTGTALDTGLSRDSAGVIDVGNGTAGDKSGSMKMTNLTLTGTCTGCGSGSSVWSGLTAPIAPLTITMPSGDNTAFTWAANASPSTPNFAWISGADTGTSTTPAFQIIDTTASTKTGSLVDIHTVGTSTANPISITAQGTTNGLSISSAGLTSLSSSAGSGNILTINTGAANFLQGKLSGTTEFTIDNSGRYTGNSVVVSSVTATGLTNGDCVQTGSGGLLANSPAGCQIKAENVVSFSTTPVFSVNFGSNIIVLTGSLTSWTLAAGTAGQNITLTFCQNGTGGFGSGTTPSNVHGFFGIGMTASKCSSQSYTYSVSQTAWLANSPGVINE